MKYTKENAEAINVWKRKYGLSWMRPIDHATFLQAKKGKWDITLTPVRKVPHAWLGDVRGKKVLGLAAGGGQQMAILSALGAECTVLDISDVQIESDRAVAQREGYELGIVWADMTDPFPFGDETFDMIVHPVSNHYIEEVDPVFKECYRVLKKGGFLLSGLENGYHWAFGFLDDEGRVVHSLPFNPLKNEEQRRELEQNDMGLQFSHTLEEQIGGQLRAGFRLLDLYEDTDGGSFLHDKNVPTYIATLAKKE